MINLFLRRCLLLVTGCLLANQVSSQSLSIIPDSGQQQIRSLPVEARDTVYRHWGQFYYAKYTEKDLANALECYTSALRIATKYNHDDVVRLCQYDLGTVYDAMNNFAKATEYYQLFFAEQLRQGDPKRIFRSAYNLATVASKSGNKAKVREYAVIMQRYLKSISDRDDRLKGNLMLANLMSRNHDTIQFLMHYHLLPDSAVFEDGELAYGRLYAETKSNYIFYKGDGQASLTPLYAALAITRDSVPLISLVIDREEEIGDYKASLRDQKLLEKVVFSHANGTVRYDIENRMLGMNNELVERRNELLELQQSNLLQQRRQLYGIAGMLLIGFLIATYSFFRIKAQNQKISSQNQQIMQQHNNNETLLREVHHRVKNNLQIINSVVELQQLKQDVSPADSIKEMQVKMQSIALAHELIYEQERIEYVPLQDLFDKLISIISRIYSLPRNSIMCNVKMNDLKLNLDKTLLLVLAVNELIVNTLKHANPVEGQCRLDLTCEIDKNWYVFCYRDYEPALFETESQSGNMATRLIRNLIKQLGGTVLVNNNKENLEYIFTFTP